MRIGITHLTKRRSGRYSRREEHLDVERLSIGRGMDNELPLSGLSIELHHSRIQMHGGEIRIRSVEASSVRINQQEIQDVLLHAGDTLRIGRYAIRVIEPAEDDDLALEVEELEEERAPELRVQTGLRWLTPGRLAIGAGLVALALVLSPGFRLVGKQIWESGPSSRVHSFIVHDCGTCHEGAFQRVRDSSCLSCHAAIGAHTSEELASKAFGTTGCADCHREHNGRMGLAALEQKLCVDCHGEIALWTESSEIRDVSDFGIDHPGFRLAVVGAALPDGSGRSVERRTRNGTELREESGVSFSHASHVGRALEHEARELDCSGCHSADVAGKNMLPISFEENCHSCHSLSFDERFDRQAMHTDPVEMRRDLLEFYAEVELRAIIEDRGRLVRRRPGMSPSEARRAAALAAAKAMVVRADVFLMNPEKPGACALCHGVLGEDANDGGHRLAPVAIASIWMPKGEFRHATHLPFPCSRCHPAAAVYDASLLPEAQTRPSWSLEGAGPYALLTPVELRKRHDLEPSVDAGDILIPGIADCRSCHGGERASAPQVPSSCVLCHPFHRPEHGSMGPREDRQARLAPRESR